MKGSSLTVSIAIVSIVFVACACSRSGSSNLVPQDPLEFAMILQPSAENCSQSTFCILYRSASGVVPGSSLGITGADAACNSDTAKPPGRYKAVIVDGNKRTACTSGNCAGGISEHQDWVLYPNREYRRSDRTTKIFVTNANGIFVFGLAPSAIDQTSAAYWTGLSSTWTTDFANQCSAWTSQTGSGSQGFSPVTDAAMISGTITPCSNSGFLLCAQQ